MVEFRNMNENSAKNFNKVTVGSLELYFSYETVVAFKKDSDDIKISVNDWGNTTGKHLNWIDRDKTIRIENDKFVKMLSDSMKSLGL